jgi:cystathionine gamma-synthase
VTAPLDRTTAWPYTGGDPGTFSYQRDQHPAAAAAEAALGTLDGGHAVLYGAGIAAVTGVVLTLLRPGDTVAFAAGAYYGTGKTLATLGRWGVETVEFDQTGPPPDGVELVWLEAPSNPMLTMPDFEAAAAHPALVVCDATVATPLYVRPLDHGCDIAVHSATKFLGGHHDLLLGAAICRDPDTAEQLHETRRQLGLTAAPDPAWLLLRSLETLEVRVERQTRTARVLAERLAGHAAVTVVRYPGFSGLLSFDVADLDAALRVETATTLIANQTSLGGTHTTMESRRRWEGERCPAGLLRLSVGLEDVDALWSDLERALAAA